MTRSAASTWRIAFTSALVLPLTAGCIAGTGSGGEPAAPQTSEAAAERGPVELEFWTINLRANYEDYIQGLIDEFEASQEDVTIEWVDVPGGEMSTRLLAAVASGDAPDVVNLESASVDPFADQLVDLGQHLDDEALTDYQPGLLDSGRRDSGLLSLPWYSGGATVAWYNEDILAQAGAGEGRPTTWDEALDLADEVAAATDVCGFSAIPDIEVFQQYGVEMLDDSGAPAFDTPEAAQILDRWRESYRTGGLCPGSVSQDERNLPQTVQNGLAAFSVGRLPFELSAIKDNAPAVYETLSVERDVTGTEGTYILSGIQTLAVTTASEHPDLAAELAAFVTNGENQLEFCKLVPIFPSTISSLEDPLFADIDTEQPVDAARAIVVDQLPETVSMPLGTGNDQALRDALNERVRAFLSGDQPAEEALAAAVADWEQEIAR